MVNGFAGKNMTSSKKTERPPKKKTSSAKSIEKKSIGPKQIKQFGVEVKNEFNKIAWPNKKHTLGSTLVVTVFVTLIALYLGAVDLLLGKLIGLVFK